MILNDPRNYNTGGNSHKAFDDMPLVDQHMLTTLIDILLIPRRTQNTRHSSYGLKHKFEVLMPGGYISNGEMKGAMLKCGYQAGDTNFINWTFNVSGHLPIYRLPREKLERIKKVVEIYARTEEE